METTTELLKKLFDTFNLENEKFERGNSSAGTRARKALSEMSKLVKVRRSEITELKNQRKEEKGKK